MTSSPWNFPYQILIHSENPLINFILLQENFKYLILSYGQIPGACWWCSKENILTAKKTEGLSRIVSAGFVENRM
jgi:hypothetical protein